MDITFQFLILSSGFFAAIYHIINSAQWREWTVVLFSATLLFSVSPLILIFVGLQVAWIFALYKLQMSRKKLKGNYWFSFLAFLFLPIIGMLDLDFWKMLLGDTFVTLNNPVIFAFAKFGASFFIIKSFVVLRESLKEKSFAIRTTLATLLFLPTFYAGPIHGNKVWIKGTLKMSSKVIFLGAAKITWGGAALYVISPLMLEFADNYGDPKFGLSLGFLKYIYLSFAELFFDFSGYTAIALGIGNWFGIVLPPNFNRPYFARNMREYWQRWHMSLGKFISLYLFNPIVRKTGSPRLALFLAFTIIGVWHEVTLPYLTWGIMHGIAMSLAFKPPKFYADAVNLLPVWVRTPYRIILTLTWAALWSWFANKAFIA